MRLPAQTIIEIGQVTPGALVEPRDARPILLPEFRQSVTVPGVIQAVDNVPTGTQVRSFVFGTNVSQPVSQPAIAQTICILSPGFWRLQYNFIHQSVAIATIVEDALTIVLGGVRHFIASIERFTPGTIVFNNQADFLLREDSNIDILIGATGAGELVNCSASIVASKLL